MNVQAPFGGRKASGIGREFGEYVRDPLVERLLLYLIVRLGLAGFYRTEDDFNQVRI